MRRVDPALLAELTSAELVRLDRLLRLEPRQLWEPYPGPQTEALSSPADILLYGGAAGGG